MSPTAPLHGYPPQALDGSRRLLPCGARRRESQRRSCRPRSPWETVTSRGDAPEPDRRVPAAGAGGPLSGGPAAGGTTLSPPEAPRSPTPTGCPEALGGSSPVCGALPSPSRSRALGTGGGGGLCHLEMTAPRAVPDAAERHPHHSQPSSGTRGRGSLNQREAETPSWRGCERKDARARPQRSCASHRKGNSTAVG